MNEFQRLLDRVDPARYDAAEIIDALNAFQALPADQQDAEEFGAWGYAGLDQAQHPLLQLCGEAHNDFCVVRDLDGTLLFLFETRSRWASGPFFRQHISELELESLTESEGSPSAHGIPLSRAQLIELLDGLPDDPPGPVTTY